ncbi:GGDEF domain-containing protein [Seleniivibrio woodruffii]|uniref:diguanylate cyclase n=1 Tax=Seleniivibrio woodruffii TaxID=1078050 RepID=A0A4V2PSG5_9BACT|nr:GGDEF domain-containing protein [Seleniivibrio woodruffii]TCK62421.1 diguanylate cyclase (GGDEF)-like protein [Seleniivibrio woodruffii]TVZ34461.1 diguanylate cyclase (GGDEF)-like protein [Seleniivibrio woodruffii]
MESPASSAVIKVNYRIRLQLFAVILILSVIPMFSIILLYEHEIVEPKANGLLLIPIFVLLSSKSITNLLEYLLFKNTLLKIHQFSERIKDGYYDTHFVLPIQKDQDEENYLMQVLRSLESLARVVRGQNRMLVTNLNETRSEANLMKELAEKDPLTGLYNRRYFDRVFQAEAKNAVQSGQILTLILVDCDKFKQVNDTHGHDIGDRVLKQLASVMKEIIRNGRDIPFRFGGDEFGIILPQADASAARRVASRLEETYLASERYGTTLSISAVSADINDRDTITEQIRKIIKTADNGIYDVKKRGGHGMQFFRI